MTELKIYKSPWKAIKMILLGSVFILLGIFIVNQPDLPTFIGWLTILFFGLSYPIALFQLLDRRPQIIINEIGIFDRTTHKDFINWEIIQNAYQVEIHGQKFICLVVDQHFEPSKSKGKLTKKVAWLSKALGFQELNIFLGNIKINAERLTEFILTMRMADRPNRETLIKEALPNMT